MQIAITPVTNVARVSTEIEQNNVSSDADTIPCDVLLTVSRASNLMYRVKEPRTSGSDPH